MKQLWARPVERILASPPFCGKGEPFNSTTGLDKHGRSSSELVARCANFPLLMDQAKIVALERGWAWFDRAAVASRGVCINCIVASRCNNTVDAHPT